MLPLCCPARGTAWEGNGKKKKREREGFLSTEKSIHSKKRQQMSTKGQFKNFKNKDKSHVIFNIFKGFSPYYILQFIIFYH